MDYRITWKYIVEQMQSKYGFSPDSEEKACFGEFQAYLEHIWDEYFESLYEKDVNARTANHVIITAPIVQQKQDN